MSAAGIVIVGASYAGLNAAAAARTAGYQHPVTLIGDEAHLPYQRPPLSKDFLVGKAERETIYVHPEKWYADNQVELRLGSPVTANVCSSWQPGGRRLPT